MYVKSRILPWAVTAQITTGAGTHFRRTLDNESRQKCR
jgi:hypothetical protein